MPALTLGHHVMSDELDTVFGVVSAFDCPGRNRCESAVATRAHLRALGLWKPEQLQVLLARHVIRRGVCSGGCPLLDHLRETP
jgi:hypothetical protein